MINDCVRRDCKWFIIDHDNRIYCKHPDHVIMELEKTSQVSWSCQLCGDYEGSE